MVSPLCIHSGLVSATFSLAINYLWLRRPRGQEKFRKNFMEPENFRLSPNFFDANDKFEPRFEKKFFFKISNLHEFQILRKFWFYFENSSGWHLTMDFWKIESAVHYARLWRILLWVSKLIFFPMLLCYVENVNTPGRSVIYNLRRSGPLVSSIEARVNYNSHIVNCMNIALSIVYYSTTER